MNERLEETKKNSIPSCRKIEAYLIDERFAKLKFLTSEYTYVKNGRRYGFREVMTTGYGNQWRVLRNVTLNEAEQIGLL